MNDVDIFQSWLKKSSITLSDSSIYKYSRAVKNISDDMFDKKVINKSLFEMGLLELDISIANILKNNFFVAKNKKGNNMYSNALKQYRYYILSISNSLIDEAQIEDLITKSSDITKTEKDAIIKSRIGQGQFRKSLIEKYDGKCIVTRIDNIKLLFASHIKPWAICDNDSRIDVENGLLLSANFDCMFDCGLITFDNNGKIHISSFVGKENERRLHLNNQMVASLKLSSKLLQYLEYHRDVLFVK